jgi:hypothetical protein
MPRPVDLIVANRIHSVVDQVRLLSFLNPDAATRMLSAADSMPRDVITGLARDLLVDIAKDADLYIVFKCLALAKAPDSHAMLREAVQSVLDRERTAP